MQVRPLGRVVVPSPLVCREVNVKEGCFIFPMSLRNWERQGAAAAEQGGIEEEEEAMTLVDDENDDADGDGEESESAMMRTRRLALDGMVVMVGLMKGGETLFINSREDSLVPI